MIVRTLLPLATVLLGVSGQFPPPSWGMLTPSPYIQKANGTKNSITIPYDLTALFAKLGLPENYRVVYDATFEYPNHPILPNSTGYTWTYDSKGAKYEWWRPPRTEDGRPVVAAAPTVNSEKNERVWIPIGRDSAPRAKPLTAAPFYGASPIVYLLGNSDSSASNHLVGDQQLFRSIDGPVENKVDTRAERRILDFWKRAQSNSIERDFPPGFFAANRDDDSGFALLRRFAADRDDEGFARFAAVRDDEGFARFAADKNEDGFARFAAFRPAFNSDPDAPLVLNRNDLEWTRR